MYLAAPHLYRPLTPSELTLFINNNGMSGCIGMLDELLKVNEAATTENVTVDAAATFDTMPKDSSPGPSDNVGGGFV